MNDWLLLVSNAACAEKPDHIRHNAVNAVCTAALSVVSLAYSRRATEDAWNILVLRSDFCQFRLRVQQRCGTVKKVNGPMCVPEQTTLFSGQML